MALHLAHTFRDLMAQLRYAPVDKRVRAALEGAVVAESERAVLVWEPRHPVPLYAFPVEDVRAELRPCDSPPPPDEPPVVVLPNQFGWHLHDGETFDLVVGGTVVPASAFRPADPDLSHLVILDGEPFGWQEEGTDVIGHPHDPYHRVDAVPSDRHVVVTAQDGTVLADTTRAVGVFETVFPPRWYVPRDDVRQDLLEPSPTTTVCAYKGIAAYLSHVGGERDVAWVYDEPSLEAVPAVGHLCFDPSRTRLTVDGVDQA